MPSTPFLFAAQSLPPTAQAFVVMGVGVVSTLLALGVIPASFDPKKAHQWRQRYGQKMKIGGPLVFLVGLVLLGRALFV
jgi:hypothetical protein